MMDSTSKISLYTSECKKNNIKVLPPCVNKSVGAFIPENNNIRFGLLAIKNLGLGLIEKIILERNLNGEYTSLYNFVLRNYSREFNRKALEALIKSGALDSLESNRRQMLYNIEGIMSAVENEKRFSGEGQLNLFEEMGSPNEFVPQIIPEMEYDLKLELEKEATGLYLSGHPLDKYINFLNYAKFTKIIDIISGKLGDGKRVSVVGVINGFKVRQLKNNNLLGSGVIEDFSASVGITAFSSVLSMYRPLLEGKSPVILSGRITEREDREPEIICDKVELLPQNAENIGKKSIKSGLYLKLRNINDETFLKVKEILSKYKGNTVVYIYCTDTKKKLEAPKSLWISKNQSLLNELYVVLGEENVKTVEN